MNTPTLTNLRPSTPDSRDRIAKVGTVALPIMFDLKPDVFEVENQEQFSSCTANAGCSALELMYKKHGTPYDLSRMFLYHYVRQIGGMVGDNGAQPRDIGKALKNYGRNYNINFHSGNRHRFRRLEHHIYANR